MRSLPNEVLSWPQRGSCTIVGHIDASYRGEWTLFQNNVYRTNKLVFSARDNEDFSEASEA